MTRAVAIALLLSGGASSASAGPWSAGRGHYYVKLGAGHLGSNVLASPDGTLHDIPRFTKREVSAYAAYGVTDRITAILSVPLVRSSALEDFRTESGMGDVTAGLQLEVSRRGPWILAVRGLGQAPTGDETRAEGLLPTGTGVWEAELAGSVGRSLAGGRGYAFVDAGHQVRGGALRDAFSYAAQAGWNARPRLVLAVNLRGVEPYDASAREVAIGSPTGLSDRVTSLSVGPTAIVTLGRGVALQVDADRTLRAKNIARGTTLRAGLSIAR